MRFDEIKRRAAYQATGDAEETGEMEPFISQYANEAYERLGMFWDGQPRTPLTLDEDEPDLPAWAHPALSDFATWMVLRSGSQQRQMRGVQFRAGFEEAVARMLREGGAAGRRTEIAGVYT